MPKDGKRRNGWQFNGWLSPILLTAVMLFSSQAIAQQSYPLSGTWINVEGRFSNTEACLLLKKFGLGAVYGRSIPELVVFERQRRFVFKAESRMEITLYSVVRLEDRVFMVTEGHPEDASGQRPGVRRTTFVIEIIDPTTLDIIDGPVRSRYVKCDRQEIVM